MCDDPFLVDFIGISIDYSSPITIYLITSYMSTGNLYNTIHNNPPNSLNGTQKTNIALGIAHGMLYLHSLHIIHCNLKSSNILLDEFVLPKVSDFALSRTKSNESNNFQVDIFSYGIILWELLTEQIPNPQVIEMINKDPLSLFSINGINYSETSIAKLIMQCWCKEPLKRPSFEEICELFSSNKVDYPRTSIQGVKTLVTRIKQTSDIKHFELIELSNKVFSIIKLRKKALDVNELTKRLNEYSKWGMIEEMSEILGTCPNADINAFIQIEKPQISSNSPDASEQSENSQKIELNPLFTAIQYSQIISLQFLLKLHQLNVNIQDSNGNTALHLLMVKKQHSLLQMLLNVKSLNINIQNKDGLTPLHICLTTVPLDLEILKLLLNAKQDIDITIKDHFGKTPMDYIQGPQYENVRNLIMQYI